MNYIARYILKQDIIFLVPILVYIVPDKLQQTPLKSSMQPYVQFLSRVSHMLPTHVSQRDSQLTPYVLVAHSEKKMRYVTQVYILITTKYTTPVFGGYVLLIVLVFRDVICLSSSCVLCSQCCHCLWIVNSLLSLRLSITFYLYNFLHKLQYAWQICLSSLLCPVRFPHENDVRFVFTFSCLLECSRLNDAICVCLCIGVSNMAWLYK